MRSMTRAAALVALLLLGAALAVSPATASSGTTYYASLQGTTHYPTAYGNSNYYGGMGMMGSRDVKVTVKQAQRLAGQYVMVYLNGTRVGRMLVSSTGYAHHEWTGQYVPYCMRGSGVVVKTSRGTSVVVGSYR